MIIYLEQCAAHHWKKRSSCCCSYSFSSRCGLHKKRNRHPAISRLHSPQEERRKANNKKNVLRSRLLGGGSGGAAGGLFVLKWPYFSAAVAAA